MFVGKYLNEVRSDHIPSGWTEWYGATDRRIENGHRFALNENGQKVFYAGGENDSGTDVVAGKTLDFVARAAADTDTPFFAYVNPTAPHLPLQPATRHSGHPWRNAYPPVNPNTYEVDISDKSTWLRNSGSVRDLWRGWNTADYRNRMGSLLAVDDMVADTVEVLDAAGALDYPYLLFLSDNGYNMGAHRLVHKMAPYEESLHVPFVMAGPGVGQGTEDRTVLLTDIAPRSSNSPASRRPARSTEDPSYLFCGERTRVSGETRSPSST